MQYDAESNTVRLTTSELCMAALRSGDLDLRPGVGGIGLRRARVERDIGGLLAQRNGIDGYETEVLFSHCIQLGNVTAELCGTLNGMLHADLPVVEEIVSTTGRVDRSPAAWHEMQGICNAWLLIKRRNNELAEVRLTRYRPSDGAAQTTSSVWRAEDLEDRVSFLLGRVAWRLSYLADHASVRLPSAAACRFPYPTLREGQKKLLDTCYRAIRHGKRLFVQAPTGIGKTVSTLYPAVRALGEGHCDKIFYLTAKASTRREAFGAARDICNAGGRLRTVVLTAREQLCQNAAAKADPIGVTAHCNPDCCPLAAGFYDRVPVALCDLLDRGNGFPRMVIEQAARDYALCPYELQLELSEFCDTVICDYNYVFDPTASLRRYFAQDGTGGRFVLLVDEAHNLVDRARGMYSAELTLSDAQAAWTSLTGGAAEMPEDANALGEFVRALKTLRKLCREDRQIDAQGTSHGYYLSHGDSEVCRILPTVQACRDYLTKQTASGCTDPNVSAFWGAVKRFLVIAERYDSHFLTFLELHGRDLRMKLVCLDPSSVLDEILKRMRATVFFSATLTPTDYFAAVLGGARGTVRLSLPSPFDTRNFCLVAVSGVSTRYVDRESNAKKVAACIAATISGRAGNYIAFFPSYAYLVRVLAVFREKYPKVEVIEQMRDMGQSGKETFLSHFADDGKLRVFFCVLGGSFSEGVDLPGGRLIGVITVGVGLPGLSSDRNILREYYDAQEVCGYDYAYTYPGMNRVLQAVGRVIRREEDRGIAVLIDDRWREERFRRLFPEHWQGIQYAGNARELANIVSDFWDTDV